VINSCNIKYGYRLKYIESCKARLDGDHRIRLNLNLMCRRRYRSRRSFTPVGAMDQFT